MRRFALIIFLLNLLPLFAQNDIKSPLQSQDSLLQKQWVDSIYATLSTKERIAQLFMVQIMSADNADVNNKYFRLVNEYGIGGIIYSKGSPMRQAKLNNK